MSYLSLTYHLVFATYKRMPTIDINHERELYKFIFDFATKRGACIRRIGGMPDHIHILCDIPAKMAVSDFVKIIKSESSKFMTVNNHFPVWHGWAEGYAAFTVDASLREMRRRYIINQKVHHAKRDFADELREFLLENGIDCPVVLGD